MPDAAPTALSSNYVSSGGGRLIKIDHNVNRAPAQSAPIGNLRQRRIIETLIPELGPATIATMDQLVGAEYGQSRSCEAGSLPGHDLAFVRTGLMCFRRRTLRLFVVPATLIGRFDSIAARAYGRGP